MRFLLDESAEVRIARFLETEGHDVKYVLRDFPIGLPDAAILALAHSEQRVLITNDRDFGELVFRLHHHHSGVVYFRLPDDADATQKIDWMRRILTQHVADLGKYIVVEPGRLRIS
jgi:predicted nuclease of predicted toxin-antitoxin system